MLKPAQWLTYCSTRGGGGGGGGWAMEAGRGWVGAGCLGRGGMGVVGVGGAGWGMGMECGRVGWG